MLSTKGTTRAAACALAAALLLTPLPLAAVGPPQAVAAGGQGWLDGAWTWLATLGRGLDGAWRALEGGSRSVVAASEQADPGGDTGFGDSRPTAPTDGPSRGDGDTGGAIDPDG